MVQEGRKQSSGLASAGCLYVVSTPIGNLEDITLRALRVLKEADVICAEDTRTARRLLSHYQIQPARLLSYYSYNERKRLPQVLSLLKSGQQVALISEAGTPAISDPGHRLVVEAIKSGIRVVPVPGPSAVLAALVASGLPTDRFLFEGFLPRKKGRQTKLKKLAQEEGTIILFESAQRIRKTVEDIVRTMGNRYIVISRELTKTYEEFIRGFAEELLAEFDQFVWKGELVLLVAGKDFKPFH
ncbi:MAG: 16S rRNA (cytidine(1402)-2'-O)-methyltransferase [Calditrichaeota bacterium]|nr:MAG: 16S rRNA (cytidine(1402)-2'-O)-methyltransferase [Calditrichota bacterium]